MATIKRYSELIKLSSFDERFDYLKLTGNVGDMVFGANRYYNQRFYNSSSRWKSAREKVIIRDEACDLAVPGLVILDRIFVHHINPLTMDDIFNDSDSIYDPEFLICVSMNTHNAIHYGTSSGQAVYKERQPNDTIFW